MFKHDDLNKKHEVEENPNDKDRNHEETNNLHDDLNKKNYIEETPNDKERKDGKHEETNYLLDSRHS